MRILIVDDEAWMRRTLSAMLTKWGYEVLEAADGAEAWEMIAREPVGMVICDWVMPRLDGVALCRQLRAAEMQHYVYLILLTGKEQNEDIFTAFEAGADDFSTKPVNPKELRVRIQAGERVLRLEQGLRAKNAELADVNQALRDTQARIRRDLEAAAAVQRSLLPATGETGLPLRLAWSMTPADDLGGDIFNFHRLDQRRLGFYLIDVSGHGVPAAMFSVHLTRLLTPGPHSSCLECDPAASAEPGAAAFGIPPARAACALRDGVRGNQRETPAADSPRAATPDQVVRRLNQGFQIDDRNMIYFTMIYGIIDAATGEGTLCQAGHPYPLLARREGGATSGRFAVETLGDGGFPVGLIPEADYRSHDFRLNPGDRLLLYSDGVTECFAPDRTAYGLERLSAILADSGEQSLEGMLARVGSALETWRTPAGGVAAPLSDDVSMLAIERLASQ
jgi:sigma-B regulation protein RsbU (phosphoserine phosphatase)